MVDRGQGFLRDAHPREHFKAVSAAGLHLVPFWKWEGLAVWFTALGARKRRKAVGFTNLKKGEMKLFSFTIVFA